MSASPLTKKQVRWARRWMTLVLIGLFIFIIGIEPDLIGLDRSPVVGFVQIGVWLTGLAILLLGATLTVRVVRNSRPNSLRSEIGLRLIATGYVFAVAASFADFLGIGSHALPTIYFGPLQVIGLALGVLISLLGVILYWPSRARRAERASGQVEAAASAD
ncbi:MAG: hypothetical protein AABY97_04500 [Chloroflexota bacterium]